MKDFDTYMNLVGPSEADWRQAEASEQRQASERAPVAASRSALTQSRGKTMKMTATNSGGDFPKPTPGMVPAVCVSLIDLGTQDGGMYGPKRKLMLAFEIDERRDDGKRFRVSAAFNRSMHAKAKLRQTLEGWRGKAYSDGESVDLDAMLGKPAMLTLVESEDGQYINIQTVSPLVRGMEPMQPEDDLTLFDFDAPDWDRFQDFGARLRERMEKTPEYAAHVASTSDNWGSGAMQAHGQPASTVAPKDDFDDLEDVPF